MVVAMENREYASVIGSSAAPGINGLARRYGLATAAYGESHPSLPNYLELVAGTTFGVVDDCTTCAVDGPTLVDQLETAGIGWAAYLEGVPGPCFTGAAAGRYAKRHNPFVYVTHLVRDPRACARLRPLSALPADLAAPDGPAFVWVTPDLCHDGHDCATAEADAWVSQFIASVRATPWYSGGGAIVLVWDEGSTSAGCCSRARGGHIPLVVVSEAMATSRRLDQPLASAGVLRGIERRYSLGFLGDAACACNGDLFPLLAA